MRAQSAMESIILAAALLLLTVPASFLILSFSKSSEAEISQNQINKVGTDISSISEKVYYQGYPSRITIKEIFPAGITRISIVKNWADGQNELVFMTSLNSEKSEISFPFKVNIAGEFPPESYGKGLKTIKIETVDNSTPYVRIAIT